MSTFNAGAIKADLTLGRASWTKDLRQTKKEIEDLEKKSISIMIDADDDNARVVMDNIEALLDDLDQSTYTPNIDLDEDELDRTLDRLKARLEAFSGKTYSALLDVDTDNAQVGLSGIELFLEDFEGKTYAADVEVNTREAIQEILRLEGMLETLTGRTYYVAADSDFDNAYVGLNNLELAVEAIDGQKINLDVDVDDINKAVAELSELETVIGLVDGREVGIDVDIDDIVAANLELAELDLATSALDRRSIDIDVDYDEDALDGLVGTGGGGGGGGGSLGLLRLALYALAILSPVLSVAISSSLAAVVGFAGALVAAGGAALVLGGGLALLISEFKEAKKAGEMTPAMEALDEALTNLKETLDVVKEAIGDSGFALMADSVELLSSVLIPLIPIFNNVADAFRTEVLGGIEDFVNSPEFDMMIEFFSGFGVDMLVSFMKILGNLTLFFGRLFHAFEPFITAMMDGLEELTAGWADWANELESNEGFQDFLDDALKYGPMVLKMLGSLLAALMNVGEALEPFAGPMLDGLTWFFDLIANADPEALTAIIAGLAGLWLGLNVIAPVLTAVAGGVTAVTAALGIGILPLLAIVAIIGAFAFALYELWQTNEDFREGIISTWENIRDTFMPIIEDITSFFMEHWDEVKEWFQDFWEDFKVYVYEAMAALQAIIAVVLGAITFLWENFGDDIMNLVSSAISTIGGIISGLVQVVTGIMQVIKGIFTGDFGAIKTGIGNIVQGIFNIVRTVFGQMKTVMTTPFTAAKDFIVDKFNSLIGFVGGLGPKIAAKASGMWHGITDAFKSAINAIISAWNSLEFSIPGYDWPGPGGFDGITLGVPDIPKLAMGGYITDPTMAWVGEGSENEIVAPESKMNEMADRAAGNAIDPKDLAWAIAQAMGPWFMRMNPITAEDLERLIEAAGVNIDISGMPTDQANSLAKALGYELRVLGYGGKASA